MADSDLSLRSRVVLMLVFTLTVLGATRMTWLRDRAETEPLAADDPPYFGEPFPPCKTEYLCVDDDDAWVRNGSRWTRRWIVWCEPIRECRSSPRRLRTPRSAYTRN